MLEVALYLRKFLKFRVTYGNIMLKNSKTIFKVLSLILSLELYGIQLTEEVEGHL